MKKMIVYGLIMLVLVLATELVKAEQTTLQIEGSTTVGPIADAFAEVFKKDNPGLSISVNKTGSGNGAAALIDGRCDIAILSRFMKDKEFSMAVEKSVYPVAHVVAMDGVCIVVHPSNPIKELTTAQIRDIYKGAITNWNQVGGIDMAIIPISRDTSSGTYETFHELVMNKQEMGSKVEYVNANPQAHARVRTTPGAIGYVGVGFLDGNVKTVVVDGVTPSRRTIANGTYPIARPLFMFTNGYPKLGSVTHQYCTFYLSEVGQEIVEAKGFIPLTNY
ncbi:MAG: phosphate ABC transporter substrate-binding protein [Phycisphaerae bacterium]